MTIELPYIENYSDSDYQVASDMMSSLFYRISNNEGPTSLPFWMNKFSNHNEANRMIIRLAKDNIIKTAIQYNYATIELNKDYVLTQMSNEDFYQLIRDNKLNRYKPLSKVDSTIAGASDVKLPSGVAKSGLLRTGLAKCGTHQFKYDIAMLKKYYDEVVADAVKSMKAMEAKLKRSLRDANQLDYESTVKATINYIIENHDNNYVLGKLTSDSRGRAIYKCLTTVFNPIANKFARSLVVMPEYTIQPEDLEDAYLFISEVVHGFNGDIEAKLQNGKDCYATRRLPEVHGSETYERIWIERIYAELDAYFIDSNHKFTTPIEVDFSSSNLVIIGLLLNHTDYVDHTNYMWQLTGLSKLHVKKAQTPYVFGSRAPITRLWRKAKLDFTSEQVAIMRKEQIHGKFAIANELKDLIITHCQPTPAMTVQLDKETFRIECNRHKIVGDTTRQYVCYDSTKKTFKVISHTDIVKVPDLYRYKTYFMTLLIHNLDSQCMNRMTKAVSWVLPIHDAGIISIAEARTFKQSAVDFMQYINDNRQSILLNYFKSINLDNEGYIKYAKLQAKVDALNEGKSMNLSPYLLK